MSTEESFGKRSTYGFLFYDFSDSRALDVIKGIKESIGNNRLCLFPAGPLNSKNEMQNNDRRMVLNLLKSCDLDGLITLEFWESESWFKSVLHDELSCPIVPLLRSYSVCTGITVPYDRGSNDAVSHLIETHGCRKPFYLIGSAGNSVALSDRYNGFRKALENHGITHTADMLVTQKGSFSTGGLVSGVLHQGSEAVDYLFKVRKLIPGKDVDSLVIFNDRMAIEVIDALFKMGIRVPEDIKIVSHDNVAEADAARVPLSTSAIPWSGLGRRAIEVLRKISRSETIRDSVLPEFIVRQSCGCPKPVETLMQKGFEDLPVQEKRDLYQLVVDDYSSMDSKRREAIEAGRRKTSFRDASILLSQCETMDAFTDAYCRLLSYLDLKDCSLYTADSYNSDYRQVLKWSDGKRLTLDEDKRFTLESLNSEMQTGQNRVCESLDQGNVHLGLLFFSLPDLSSHTTDDLRDITSNSLYSLNLMENLKATQEQLVQDEKYSSLGLLVSGVAHEVNTPIGIGVTASSHLVTTAQDLAARAREGDLTEDFYLEKLESIAEVSEMIQRNLGRAGDLIKSFKNVSADNVSDTIRRYRLKPLLNDIVLSMKPFLKAKNPEIVIECSDDIQMYSNPGILTQILSNLIMNTMIHGFSSDSSGKIVLKGSINNDQKINLIYEDNGQGMEPEVLNNIYEPFFTTGRDKGCSGLGMFIVFNMVTQKMKGRINIHSSPNAGVHIEMTFPENL